MTSARPIMIVDDDDDLREILTMLLELHGYRVITARDGVEALERLSGGEEPALILLDMMMPRLDGEGFIAALRREHRERIPIVMLSGHWQAQRKAAELGTALLVKPIAAEQVVDVVRRFAKLDASAADAELPG
jgi:CheY-like chemotaxis protein